MSKLWKILTRKKALDPVSLEETQLNRVLNTFDLTALGVGSTLGVGVYVLTGQVAKDIAGPSVILSFLIAAIASVFAALCYAEFGARAPRAGSAYIYSYVCVGELVAFIIGWNLILEYVIGSASVARGLSGYLDTLINNTLQDTFRHIAPIHVNYMSAYFDFFAFGISVFLAVALAIGVKESSIVNNVVTVLNVGVVFFVIVTGSFKANLSNWEVQPNEVNSTNSTANIGQGGFFPFGVEGMIKGAAKCFYAFVGFDAIATTGEEAQNPRRAIPIAILASLFISFCAYFGTSTVLTLMVPYYLQDKTAPLPVAFEDVGWYWAKWVVAIGAMFGLCASLFGAMFPLPRIIFAMGSDGLVFKFLAKVHSRFKTPFVGTVLAGLLTGLMAALFELEHLVNMMSIGTLLAYTIVAASVLLLSVAHKYFPGRSRNTYFSKSLIDGKRYAEEKKPIYATLKTTSESDSESVSSDGSDAEKYSDDYGKRNMEGINSEDQELIDDEPVVGHKFLHVFNCYQEKTPNKLTEKIVATEVLVYCVFCVLIGLAGRFLIEDIKKGEVWAIVSASVPIGLAAIVVIMIVVQPKSRKELSFRVPFVPLVPALSILVNIYLMMMLDAPTWIRFGVWMGIGIPMYIYCVSGCGRKQNPPNTQLVKNAVSDSTSSTLKLSNGLSNPAFVDDTPGIVAPTKKGKAPLPPPLSPTSDKSENIEIQQKAVIAQLDEILDKEVAISQLDDILENETVRLNEHRLSDGTLSNMSAIVSRKEDVVADVHHDNVLATPPADPKLNAFPVCVGSFKENNPDFNDKEEVKDTSDDEGINLSVSDENIPELTSNVREKIETHSPPPKERKFYIGDDKEPEISNPIIPTPPEFPRNEITNLQTLQSHVAREELVPKLSQTYIEPKSPKEETTSISFSFTEATLRDSEGIEAKSFDKLQSTAFSSTEEISPPRNNKTIDGYPESPPRTPFTPTKDALKSVTLRKVTKALKELEPPLHETTASETNLRVGSEEYQQFRDKLNNKLKRLTVIPSLVPVPRTDIVIVPKDVESSQPTTNENVIEDPIDKRDAMLKLKTFLESQTDSNGVSEPKNSDEKKLFLKGEDRSKSVDESVLKSSRAVEFNEPEPRLSTVEEIVGKFNKKSLHKSDELIHDEDTIKQNDESAEFNSHKQNMKNIFDTINLKNTNSDPTESKVHKRKLSKSLGSSFLKEDDQTIHRRKMDDIFHSITALRKSSLSQTSAGGNM